MMLVPSIFGESLFDDFFGFPEFRDLDRAERKLYGRHADRVMKADVREHEDHYEVDMDLPGFRKEDISVDLHDGYLTVSASKNVENEEEKKGKLIRQERYTGAMQRSFYVGEQITEEDIKANFQHGVLSLQIPKNNPQLHEKKRIMIEG